MDDFTWVEDYNGQPPTPVTSIKRKVRPKRYEFLGWGSRQLIEFLQSIGKDTESKISQYDVADIINKYVTENKLTHPVKKKRVSCDEKLLCLFGRKTISRIKIYDLLGDHYAENKDDSDFDFLYSSDDEQQKSLRPEKKYNQKKNVVQKPQSCFAAIISDNIKLVYLKRSLVQELAKESDSFQTKMVGSFVRIKSDPNDYLRKYSHLLVQVTGVRKADRSDDFLFQVTNCTKDVHMSMLSDDNFSKEECEDLSERIKDGLLKRPTVVEMQEKIRVLHEDVIKHWLEGEVILLQKLIDRANEKGWRREALTLFDYLEKKELLQKPEEQSRLLREVPEVIPEELETPRTDLSDDEEERESGSEMQSPPTASDVPNRQSCKKQKVNNSVTSNNEMGAKGRLPAWIFSEKDSTGDQTGPIVIENQNHIKAIPSESKTLEVHGHGETRVEVSQVPSVVMNGEKTTKEDIQIPLNRPVINLNESLNASSNVQVIELSDDDEPNHQNGDQNVKDKTSLLWYYRDPQGNVQGPFSLSSLKAWRDADYFPQGFKVWMMGQSQEQAVLLSDVLLRVFPN